MLKEQQKFRATKEYQTFEHFLRVIKNHRLYGRYKNVLKELIKNSNSPFHGAKNVNDLIKKLRQIADNGDEGRWPRQNTKYDEIVGLTNILLHNFVEKGHLVSSERVPVLGQECFDLTCYAIWGDEFLTDMDEFKQKNPRGEDGQVMSKLHQAYEYHRHHNNIPPSMPFEEFCANYAHAILSPSEYRTFCSTQNEMHPQQQEEEYDDDFDFDDMLFEEE